MKYRSVRSRTMKFNSITSPFLIPSIITQRPGWTASVARAPRLHRETLQVTALVHEAYLRLVHADQEKNWDSRGHFFAAAAAAMRRILVESARRKESLKRGCDLARVEAVEWRVVRGAFRGLSGVRRAFG